MLDGVVRKVYRKDSGFTVMRVAVWDKDEREQSPLITAVGHTPQAPRVGHRYTMTGQWMTHQQYGKQFHVESLTKPLPTTAPGIEVYLASGIFPGVGPVLAKRIVERFGQKTLEVIKSEPQRLLEVSGVGPAGLTKMMREAPGQLGVAHVVSDLCRLGLTQPQAMRALETLGDDAYAVIRDNPYRAVEVWGLGFRKADAVAKRLKLPRDNGSRFHCAIDSILNVHASHGIVRTPVAVLLTRMAELCDIDITALEHRVDEWMDRQWLIKKDGYVYAPLVGETQRTIEDMCGHLVRRQARRESEVKLSHSSQKLTMEHRLAVKRALAYPLSLVVGGVGVGLPTCLQAIVHEVRETGLTIGVASPTTGSTMFLDDDQKLTIQWDDVQGSQAHPQAKQLKDLDVLMVVQAEQLDLVHAARLLNAVDRDRTRVVIVGDDAQVPLSGPGWVFRASLQVGMFPVTRITQVESRQKDSGRVSLIRQIRDGNMPKWVSGLFGKDCLLRMVENLEDAKQALSDVMDRLSFAPKDIQVIGVGPKGPLGTMVLNRWLQDRWSTGETSTWMGFRVGDRVRTLRSNREKGVWATEEGDVRVVSPQSASMHVVFSGREVVYQEWECDELILAYALTIREVQGLRKPCAVVVLPPQPSDWLTRERLLTALCVGTQYLVVLGSPRTCKGAVRNTLEEEQILWLIQRQEVQDESPD